MIPKSNYNSRVLIIGGAGLLGSFLTPKLKKAGHEVALCDKFSGSMLYRAPKDTRIFSADATQLKTLEPVFNKFNPEIVVVALNYHYKKKTRYKFSEDVSTVLNSSVSLASLVGGIKHLYFCSSAEVYGGPEPRVPLKETRKIIRSSSHHGTAKKAAEDLLAFRCQELGVPLTIIRIFDLFGPRIMFNPRTGVINSLIDSFLTHEQIGLSGATKSRDFIHAEDASNLFMKIIKSDFTGVINLGTGKGTTLISLCKELSKYINVRYLPFKVPDGKNPTYSTVADTSLLKEVVGRYRFKHDVFSSLPDLVDFRKEEMRFYDNSNAANVLAAQRKEIF